MKPLYLIANWKSNKTVAESIEWVRTMGNLMGTSTIPEHCTIIVCPPFTALAAVRDEIRRLKLPIHVGAQDVSQFTHGAYTGEINVTMLKELAEFVIIGHSERRKYFSENTDLLTRKIIQAKSEGLRVIYCVEENDVSAPDQVDFIAYEPVSAIGTGNALDPQSAETDCNALSTKNRNLLILYGGSVTAENCAEYLAKPSIHGALIGGAGLDPNKFFQLIQVTATV